VGSPPGQLRPNQVFLTISSRISTRRPDGSKPAAPGWDEQIGDTLIDGAQDIALLSNEDRSL
jgi:hypothetical protein